MKRRNTNICIISLFSFLSFALAGTASSEPILSWETPAGTCRVFEDRVEVGKGREPRPGPKHHGISVESLDLLIQDAAEIPLAKRSLEVARQALCGERQVGPQPPAEPLSIDPDPYPPEILGSLRACGLRELQVTTPAEEPTLEVIKAVQVRINVDTLYGMGWVSGDLMFSTDTLESLLRDAARAPLTSGHEAPVASAEQPCVPYLLGWVSDGSTGFRPVPIEGPGFGRVGVAAELLRRIAKGGARRLRM